MQQVALARFTVVDSPSQEAIARLGDADLDVDDVDDGGRVIAECDQSALATASLDDFPDALVLRIHSEDGFGTFLFHEVAVYTDSGQLTGEYICHQPNKYWEGRWGLATFLNAVKNQIPFSPHLSIGEVELDDDWKRLTLRIPLDPGSATEALSSGASILKKIMREAEIALGGIHWKAEYETDERAFCEEVLAPLLRRMGFLSVRYMHGVREYGKDFTFSELTPFGVMRHYGFQAKAGDVSGGVNSAIDELIGQADDAFKMPYYEIASTEPRYISTFIVGISGRFTSNAKDKIVQKVPRGVWGSLLFLDRELIIELIGRYWTVG
jgi:hypothetical protein